MEDRVFSFLGRLREKTDDLFGRSGQWARVRREHLEREPACIACGRTDDLEIHHAVPYHEDQSKELDPANLCTMCHDCHLSVAHAYNWKTWRPDVRRLAQMLRSAEVRR